MRTFIAIGLPPEIREGLGKLQTQLKATGADVKWVAPENIHLTLKFLGEVNETQIAKIGNILADIGRSSKAFSVRLNSIGTFPKIQFPKVIWVGIDKGDSESKTIAAGLEEKLVLIGIPKEERPFSSHITIGRVRSYLNRDKLIQELKNLEGNIGGKFPEFPVNRLTLYKSTLTPKGPLYEILQEASLATI